MTYALASLPFFTIQGEGANAGRAALFVRFAGCNLWSGAPETRERDAARNAAECPRFCDTEFRPRVRMTVDELAEYLRAAPGLVVFTGGEPLLQLDAELLAAVPLGVEVAIETNGTIPVGDLRIDHVCVSPKVGPERLAIREGAELKVVVPDYDPLRYEHLAFARCYVQPRATLDGIDAGNVALAVQFVMDHPKWRLSYQVHKAIGVP